MRAGEIEREGGAIREVTPALGRAGTYDPSALQRMWDGATYAR